MPRYDGYPAADPLTGGEVLPLMQGGATKSMTPDAVTAYVQAQLESWIRQMIADAGTITPPIPAAPRLSADNGSFLADDTGGHLLAA